MSDSLSFLPPWVLFGMGSLVAGVAMPLIQEKMKADPFALAFGNKVFTVLWMTPFVVATGFPSNPMFYVFAAMTAVLWSIADVIYFRALPVVGAAVVSRLIPSAILITFVSWFLFDPALLKTYMTEPVRGGALAAIILAATFLAMRLKRCAVSWAAVKMIWPLIAAAAVGPILLKLCLGQAPAGQAPYAFAFVQALIMIGYWSVFNGGRRLLTPAANKAAPFRSRFLTRTALTTALMVSVFSASGVVLKNHAMITVDHPAYLSVLLLCDSLIIALIHRAWGRRDDSDLLAGFGIVACAAALIIVKSL